ncbi:MAG: flagellar basal body-associated FliL family protein [Thermoanaerobacterales bacterium]|nr:flagellar basal body-associated FliL family protein [Bacillota bacterium]MDI6906132.1 flagellar basal body-associated FliL family protein [Thermoanaerobacterales bacterium]
MPESTPAPPKKKGGKLILIIALIALVGAGAAAGSYFFFARSGEPKTPKPPPQQVVDMGSIVVNLENADSGRYLRVGLSLVYPENPKLGEEIAANQQLLKDRLIDVLRRKKAGDIGDAAKADLLKRELLQEVNKYLHEGQVEQIYFTEFLVQ